MHQFQVDNFNGIEFGIARMEYFYGGGGVSAPSAATRTTVLHNREVKVDGKPKSVPVTATDQAKEAIKDGKISKNEKTAFDKNPVTKDVVKDEQKRLADAVKKATGDDHLRDKDGKLVLDDKGKAQSKLPYGYSPYGMNPGLSATAPTDHEKRVASLKDSKDGNATQIQERIDSLKADGVPESQLTDLVSRKNDRLAEEAKVVDVVADKTAYIGTLEAEKAELTAGTGSNEKTQAELRTKAQDALERFVKYDGKVHDASTLAFWEDDWKGRKDSDPDKVFNELAKQFKEDPKLLDQFVGHQGDDNDAIGDWDKHLQGIDDPATYDKVLGRKKAAEELAGIFKQYNAADNDASNDRIKQIDAEIDITQQSIEADKAVLSKDSLTNLDNRLKPVDGIIPEPKTETTTTAETKPQGGDKPEGGDKPQGGNGTPDAGGTDPKPKMHDVKIDYTKPEAQKQVLDKARGANLLPGENVSFNAKGEAQYKVQPGDSYWRIADMSDGKAPHEFDSQHFSTMLNDNSSRLGRDPQVGMLYVDDQVVIPGRSVDELVKLLDLPTTESVPVEEEPETRPTGGRVPQAA